MARNVAGMLGSVLGVAAGLTILVDLFMDINLAVGPYNIYLVLWVLYLFIQSIGFLVLHVQARNVTAVVSSGLGIVVALGLMMPQFFLALLPSVLTMALYAIVGGVAFLHISGNGGSKSSHTQAGILFILLGPSFLLGTFPVMWFIFPPLVVGANVAAYRAFSSAGLKTAPGVTTMQPSQGVNLQ